MVLAASTYGSANARHAISMARRNTIENRRSRRSFWPSWKGTTWNTMNDIFGTESGIRSVVPTGLIVFCPRYPAINRWAILFSPSGTDEMAGSWHDRPTYTEVSRGYSE